MKACLLATALIYSAVLARATALTDEREAIEKAVTRYAEACLGRDVVQAYALASPELRLSFRWTAGVFDASLDVSNTDDIEGFRAVAQGPQREGVSDALRSFSQFVRFTRVVQIDVKGDAATCFVFDADMQRLREEHTTQSSPSSGPPTDPSQWTRLLITVPRNTAAAEASTKDPRKESTGIILLRREGAEWRVSHVAPVGPAPGARQQEQAPVKARAGPGEAALGDGAVLDVSIGTLTVRKIVEAATASHRTVAGPELLDVFGPMSEGFKAFVVKKLRRDLVHSHVDLTFSPGEAGQLFLLNPDEPTVGDTGGVTDKQMWQMMVEFAGQNGK